MNWPPRSSPTCATASRTTRRRSPWTSSTNCQGRQPESLSNGSLSTNTRGAHMSEFTGKRYVVTGAASGIGHAVAETLLQAGAEVYSLDRNAPTAAVTRHIEVDLSNPRSIDA